MRNRQPKRGGPLQASCLTGEQSSDSDNSNSSRREGPGSHVSPSGRNARGGRHLEQPRLQIGVHDHVVAVQLEAMLVVDDSFLY